MRIKILFLLICPFVVFEPQRHHSLILKFLITFLGQLKSQKAAKGFPSVTNSQALGPCDFSLVERSKPSQLLRKKSLPLRGKSLFGEILTSSMGAAAQRISSSMDFGASATRISRSQSDPNVLSCLAHLKNRVEGGRRTLPEKNCRQSVHIYKISRIFAF